MYAPAAFCVDFSSLLFSLTLCLHAGLLLLNMVISVISEGLAEILENDLSEEGKPRYVNVLFTFIYICVMRSHLLPSMHIFLLRYFAAFSITWCVFRTCRFASAAVLSLSVKGLSVWQQDELKFFAQMKKALGMELKTENIFNALENIDEDGDKLISKEEIIAFCNKNPDALEVLGVSSVKELYVHVTMRLLSGYFCACA
jgi:hypothetical protein